MKRLQLEYAELAKTYDVELVGDNLYEWHIAINGPDNTPYYGGTFLLRVIFPNTYPNRSPKLIFETMIYHPNISRLGDVCQEALGGEWTPRIQIKNMIDGIIRLLKEPDTNNPLEANIAQQYRSHPNEFRIKAMEITAKYAI